MKYSASANGFYLPEIHGAAIPPDAVDISDEVHAALLAAQSQGATIQPDGDGNPVAVFPAPPAPEQAIATFTAAIDAHIEAQARAWSYNSAAHLASYVASTVPQWAAEATAFVAWRDAVWLAALALLTDAQAGEAEPPADPAEFIATLPALTRP